jgi:hypothetical protein
MGKGIDTDCDCSHFAHQIAESYDFVGRYYRMPPPYSRYPTLTRAEAQALSAAGLSIVSIWEFVSGSRGRIESLNYQAGNAEGKRAYKLALAIPQPSGTPIYFAVDEGYDPANREYGGPIDDYFQGVNDAFAESACGNPPAYAVGVYGPGAVCEFLKANGRTQYSWLANASRWPGYGFADWHLKQGFGDTALPIDNDTDECRVNAGLWQAQGACAHGTNDGGGVT